VSVADIDAGLARGAFRGRRPEQVSEGDRQQRSPEPGRVMMCNGRR
jgi:hypothetical protein